MFKKLLALFGLAVVLVFFAMFFASLGHGADKKLTLEQRVTALETHNLEAEMWNGEVNSDLSVLDKRTLDLHSRLLRVEGRGPVAEVK